MPFQGENLLNEKSLWSIYVQSVLKLSPSRFNVASGIIIGLALVVYVTYGNHSKIALGKALLELADLGLSFGPTVLGFLIAGFTIFATLTNPKLLVHMSKKMHRESGLNYLKVNFFAFVETFVVYLVFVALCLIIKFFSVDGALAPLIEMVNGILLTGWAINELAWIKTLFVLLGWSTFASFLALKSFIYNTYHAVITQVVWMMNEKELLGTET